MTKPFWTVGLGLLLRVRSHFRCSCSIWSQAADASWPVTLGTTTAVSDGGRDRIRKKASRRERHHDGRRRSARSSRPGRSPSSLPPPRHDLRCLRARDDLRGRRRPPARAWRSPARPARNRARSAASSLRRLVAVLRVLRQALQDDRVERRRARRGWPRRRLGLVAHVLHRDRHRGVAGERRPPVEHLVQHAARARRCPSARPRPRPSPARARSTSRCPAPTRCASASRPSAPARCRSP